jgi:hypothetical protein
MFHYFLQLNDVITTKTCHVTIIKEKPDTKNRSNPKSRP